MDNESRNVARFLEGVSEVVWGKDLYHDGRENGLWNKLVRRHLQPIPLRPGARLALHQRTLVVGVYLEISPERWIEFEIDIKHDDDAWAIETTVWVDPTLEEDGQRVLRSFPTRRAATLDECLAQLRAAAADLSKCDDVVDEVTG